MFRTLLEKAKVLSSANTFYSAVLDLTTIGGNDVEAHLKVTARSGTTPTLQVIPQYSYDGTDWFDIPSTQDFTLVDGSTSLPSSETLKVPYTGQYVRFKYVVTGTTPSFTFDLLARASVGGGGGSGGGISGTITTDSELPAADADGDTDADISTPDVAARLKGWNSSTWSKIRAGLTSIGSTFTGFLNTLPISIYHSSPTSRTDGQGGPWESDSKGNLNINLATRLSGENQAANRMMVSNPGTSTRITTATATIAASGAGVLKRFFIESALTGTATVYDNTAGSGTILTILPIGYAAGSHAFGGTFNLGVTVVTSAADRVIPITGPN